MSTTVNYKGSILTTVRNQTRILKTAGKYMEDDVTLVDVTGGACEPVYQDQDGYLIVDNICPPGGPVSQDQNGYIVLGEGTSIGGLEYEEGIWTPSEDVARPSILFENVHSEKPISIIMADVSATDDATQSSNYGFTYISFHQYTGNALPSNISANLRYALACYVYRGTGNPAQGVSAITSIAGDSSSSSDGYWVSTTGFFPSSASSSRYWRMGRTYKWIAMWG